jgi:hypothetical protein
MKKPKGFGKVIISSQSNLAFIDVEVTDMLIRVFSIDTDFMIKTWELRCNKDLIKYSSALEMNKKK